MRFAIGVIVLFALSFGGVFWFGSTSSAPVSVDVVELLKKEPEEYSRIYAAFRKINADEISEFNRALIAYSKHENLKALRQDIGGLMLRVIGNEAGNLPRSGRPWLEKITRKTLGLTRQYNKHGEDFCFLSSHHDHPNAEKLLRDRLSDKEAAEFIAGFKAERFELAVLMLEAIVEGGQKPVAVPGVNQAELEQALIEAASGEDADVLRKMRNDQRSCEEIIALLDSALNIRDQNTRHAMLAELNPGG